ncbi:PEP-utilizing enzyme [Streptomyces sp. NWU339]|uniref:PEP-utilizing enzyme n=1 Tax=Streptomyces sp. NWU339 TaxID=2185284 RepID=UPI0028121DDA|nr:PEP-utilizing enzyme [Streptomyces sp. NWU339]
MVASPLQQTAISGWRSEIAWRKALVDFGAFDESEFRSDDLDILGIVHGYIYMNLSIQRVFGARMPGASPELMDRTYVGDSKGAPPYEAQPGDDAPQYTERIVKSIERVFSTQSRPDLDEDAESTTALRARRPDYSALSNSELLAYSSKVWDEHAAELLRKHMLMMYESSMVTGLLEEALAPFEDPTLAVRLMGGWGGVASAAPAVGLWELGRIVAGSPELTADFDSGVNGLHERLHDRTDEVSQRFVKAFEDFLLEFGSRSTQEWDVFPPTWETHPEIALGLTDRLRLLPEDKDPRRTAPRVREEREALTAQLRERLADRPEQLEKLEVALRTMSVWMPARELSKTNFIRALHECRLPLRELGRRFTDSGHLESIEDLSLLRLGEVEEMLGDPDAVIKRIPERKEWMKQLESLEPPFVVVTDQVPPAAEWPRRSAPSALPPVQPGEILTGLGACSGSATGIARVIDDPSEATELEPGEILVAPETDPGWTPLFTSCSAVVVNVGSPLSHAAIISRELGIPAVLAVEQATKRIKTGTVITVDGTAGTVTVH